MQLHAAGSDAHKLLRSGTNIGYVAIVISQGGGLTHILDSILAILQIIRWGRPSELANGVRKMACIGQPLRFYVRFENPVVEEKSCRTAEFRKFIIPCIIPSL